MPAVYSTMILSPDYDSIPSLCVIQFWMAEFEARLKTVWTFNQHHLERGGYHTEHFPIYADFDRFVAHVKAHPHPSHCVQNTVNKALKRIQAVRFNIMGGLVLLGHPSMRSCHQKFINLLNNCMQECEHRIYDPLSCDVEIRACRMLRGEFRMIYGRFQNVVQRWARN